MTDIFGIPMMALFGQLMIGLINGAFYATLSLGLAVIFGLLNIVNFAHGAQFMMGAFISWMLLAYVGVGYWAALFLSPLIVAIFGMVVERLLISKLYKLDHLYGLLLTLGLGLIIEGLFRSQYGTSGQPYAIPALLAGGWDFDFLYLPIYRAWIIGASIAVCLATWLLIERTRLGSYLRAANENPGLVRAFGVDVPLLVTLTYGFGVALAAFAGVLAAPIYTVSAGMGTNLIIIVFAVVVIGGMGSILGSIATGFALGIAEGLTKVFYPEAATTVIFVIMAIVLLIKPAGLFGKEYFAVANHSDDSDWRKNAQSTANPIFIFVAIAALLVVLPFFVYPPFLMKLLCFALFASALSLLAGYGGLLSFGHAAFFGVASYACAHAAKIWGFPPVVAIGFGALVAALLGVVVGLLSIRRQGIYFSMVTLAFAQMVYFFCLRAPFTGAEDGLQHVPRGSLFGVDLTNDTALYWLVAGIFFAGILFIYRVIHSPFGRVLIAIREHEPRAISLGYRVNHYKLIVFILSATLAGLAGSTKAIVTQLASLTDVHWSMSGEVVLMMVLGGMGSILGPAIGAVVLVTMQNYLAWLGPWISVLQGFIFVVCVLLFRQGIIGIAGRWMKI